MKTKEIMTGRKIVATRVARGVEMLSTVLIARTKRIVGHRIKGISRPKTRNRASDVWIADSKRANSIRSAKTAINIGQKINPATEAVSAKPPLPPSLFVARLTRNETIIQVSSRPGIVSVTFWAGFNMLQRNGIRFSLAGRKLRK